MSGKTVFFLVEVVVAGMIGFAYADLSRPDMTLAARQPLRFDHKTHPVACVTCHEGAERAAAATLPTVETCMSCHEARKERKRSPLTDAIRAAAEAKETPRWTKFTDLPEHVVFSHRRHVRVGKVACTDCHGDVGASTMDRLRLVVPTMNGCLDCHVRSGASTDCAACHR